MNSITRMRREIGRRKRNWRRSPDIHWGADFISELTERTGLCPEVIVDVGAHIGITALEFADAFPDAIVHAIEPGSENFERLESNLSGKPHIQRHKLAIGAAPGEATLMIEPDHPSTAHIGSGDGASETVEVMTFDTFCETRGIEQVSLMKIDTEGYELEVLKGAAGMVASRRIDFIKLECGVNPDFGAHVSLPEIMEHLAGIGYRLFGIYDQWECTLSKSIPLRRVDAVFISAPAIEKANKQGR